MTPNLTGISLRRKAYEAIGWEWWHQYGKCYLVPVWLGDEWRVHRGLGWKPGKGGNPESEIEMDFQSMYRHAALPAIESDPAVAIPMLVEFCAKNGWTWLMRRITEWENCGAIEVRMESGTGKLVKVTDSTPCEAIAMAIVQASEAR